MLHPAPGTRARAARRRLAPALILAAAAACRGGAPPPTTDGPADLVLRGARVWTVAAPAEADAVAIRGDRILKVGSVADVASSIDPRTTRVLDLPGRLVLPGLIDSHVHLARAGRLLLGLARPDMDDAGAPVERDLPPPSHDQQRAEALRALDHARRRGVTGFHDDLEDFDELAMLQELERDGLLTARVWARLPLSEWERVRDSVEDHAVPAVKGGWGDDWIRLGGLKASVDGTMGDASALFFQPYADHPDRSGSLRDVMFPEGNLERLIAGADRAGFTVTVHAIGDQANRILLDIYSRVFAENPPRERRHRVLRARVVEPSDRPRFGALGLIAEVQPYPCIDDMRWMEARIGDRARDACAFASLRDAGARLSFGSGWPGTSASRYPIDPLLGIHAAVTRQTVDGAPEDGWHPEQRIPLEEAIAAYTLTNAWASWEEGSRGSIEAGKLADLAVIDRDVLSRPAAELKEARVLFTIVGGRIVYDAERAEPEP